MAGSLNTKSPTIKRILKEAHELSSSPSPDYHAAPLENNIFEWHFTLRGAPSSAFATGLYHGRIVLPPTYPLRPPSFRFLTPSGRFEVNREICLSISGHHEESWQPAWGLRTALVALRSFMETDAKGQLGGVEAAKSVRLRLAAESTSWSCQGCGGKTNREIMREVEEAAAAQGSDGLRKEEAVPEELSLGYKDELDAKGKGKEKATDAGEQAIQTLLEPSTSMSTGPPMVSAEIPPSPAPTSSTPPGITSATVTPTQAPLSSPTLIQLPHTQSLPPWIDKAIVGVALALAYMVLQRFLAMT